MNTEISQKEIMFYRTLLALALIVLAAALRLAPHPWNFTPVGAMALFSGAVVTSPASRSSGTPSRAMPSTPLSSSAASPLQSVSVRLCSAPANGCHPERSEGSHPIRSEFSHCEASCSGEL
jgi:hypothetical protein